jgi:hypothetical protein
LTCAQETCASNSECRSGLCDGTVAGSNCIVCTDDNSCSALADYCVEANAGLGKGCTTQACTAENENTVCTKTRHCDVTNSANLCAACNTSDQTCTSGYTCQADDTCLVDQCTSDAECTSITEYCTIGTKQCGTKSCTTLDEMSACTKTSHCDTTTSMCGLCDATSGSTENCPATYTCQANQACALD